MGKKKELGGGGKKEGKNGRGVGRRRKQAQGKKTGSTKKEVARPEAGAGALPSPARSP